MADFLTSDKGMTMLLLLGILAIVGYVILVVFEAITTDEFDPVCEQKCKDCICYDVCKRHGCDYDCQDYMTEEMLKQKGLSRYDE